VAAASRDSDGRRGIMKGFNGHSLTCVFPKQPSLALLAKQEGHSGASRTCTCQF
jgi:hypothetical protein